MGNSLIEVMKTRRSVRAFDADKMPPQQLISQIAEAGTYAPTGRNQQSPIIIVVTNKQIRDRLSKLNADILGCDFDPFYGAPVVLIVLAQRSKPTYIYDGSLVLGNLMNAAHALGIGSCWIHRAREVFDLPEGKEMLADWGIEGDYEGIGHCVIGYPSDPDKTLVPSPRKPDYVYYVK